MERIRESYHEEEASEDVSLCDLPLLNSLTKEEEEDQEEINKSKKNQAPNDAVFEPQEEFAFGSVAGGMLSAGPDMCAADEVFFRGQILPLRPSVGSDTIFNPTRPNPIRSESMDQGSLTGFRSISSSNSSSRSTTSPEAGSVGTTLKAITRVTSEPRLRTRNQFHTHPSPKLHIRASSARSSATGTTTGSRLDRASSAKIKHKSSVWDFFRLGLVRTPPPDIELQEIRAYLRSNSRAAGKGVNSCNTTPVSRSNSGGGGGNNGDNNFNDNNNTNTNTASSTSSSANGTTTSSENSAIVEKQKRRKFLSGCKCSAEAVASNAIVAKSKGNSNENININGISRRRLSNGTRLEKLLLLEEDHRLMIKMKNNNNYEYSKKKQSGRENHDDHHDDNDQKQKKQYLKKDQGRRKQAHHVSHHRTYEWLKELSHANLAMHV